jgi:hypothetical protein
MTIKYKDVKNIENTPEGIAYAIRQARGATEGLCRRLGISSITFNKYREEGMPDEFFKQFLRVLPDYV